VVGVVIVDGVMVNKRGLAWQYRKYCKAQFCGDWLMLEGKARKSQIGLWAEADLVPPWDWRKGARNTSYKKDSRGTYSPGAGKYHGNIKSQVFHFSNCRHYNCKNCTKTFTDRDVTQSKGFRTCGQCNP